MIPLKLKVRGARGFLKLSDGDIDIDFTQLRSGVIAVQGGNGAGKTTLVEFLTPYNHMPSYPGAIAANFYKPDSLIDFTFIYNNITYRKKCVIDGEKKKALTYLYRGNVDDEAKPLNPDGKNYDTLAEETFGSKDIYFKSVFMNQKTFSSKDQGVSNMTNAPAKDFFYSLLGGFDIYQLIIDAASQKRDELDNNRIKAIADRDSLLSQIKAIEADLGKGDDIQKEIEQIEQSIAVKSNEVNEKRLRLSELENTDSKRANVQSQIDSLTTDIAELKADLHTLKISYGETLTDLVSQSEACSSEITQLTNILTVESAIKDKISGIESAIKKIESLTRDKQGIVAQISTINQEIAPIQSEVESLKVKRAAAAKDINDQIIKLKGEIDRANKFIANKNEIETKAARLSELKDEITELERLRSKLTILEGKQTSCQLRIDSYTSQINNETANIKSKIDEAQKLSAKLESVPCKDTESFVSSCPLIKGAFEAKSGIKGLQRQLKDIEARREPTELKTEMANIERQISEISFDGESLSKLKGELVELSRNDWAKYKAELDSSGKVIEEKKQQLAGLAERERSSANDFDERIAKESQKLQAKQISLQELNQKVTGLNDSIDVTQIKQSSLKSELLELDAVGNADDLFTSVNINDWAGVKSYLDRASVSLEAAHEKISGLITRKESEEAQFKQNSERLESKIEAKSQSKIALDLELAIFPANLKDDLEIAKAALTTVENEHKRLTESLGGARNKLESLNELADKNEQLRNQHEQLVEDIEVINRDIAEYSLIERACSRDEIPAMKLEAIAPTIVSTATEILHGFSGECEDWEINIRTVRPDSKNKKEIETFEILVNRGHDEVPADKLSGGQQVWVELAIRNAIANYVVTLSQRHYQTMFRDETDGALEESRAQAFLDVTKSTHNLIGAHYTLFITHRREIFEQVDQRIYLNPLTQRAEILAA